MSLATSLRRAALAFALTMHFARPQAAAADYGVQSSLFAFSRVLVPAVGGWLLDRAGYAGLLAGLAAAMLGVCLLCMQRAATLPGQGFQKE